MLSETSELIHLEIGLNFSLMVHLVRVRAKLQEVRKMKPQSNGHGSR